MNANDTCASLAAFNQPEATYPDNLVGTSLRTVYRTLGSLYSEREGDRPDTDDIAYAIEKEINRRGGSINGDDETSWDLLWEAAEGLLDSYEESQMEEMMGMDECAAW